MADRPVGREKHVTSGGTGVHKRGDGLGTGPVGSHASSGQSSGGSTGGQRPQQGPGGRRTGGNGGPVRSSGGGGGLMRLLILAAIVLLGGGGGLSALLGGGGSSGSGGSSTGSYTNQSQTTTGSQSSQSGSSGYSGFGGGGSSSYSGSGSSAYDSYGSYGGDSLESMIQTLLGGGSSGSGSSYDQYEAPSFSSHSGYDYGYSSDSYGYGSSYGGGSSSYGGSGSGYGSSSSGSGSSSSGSSASGYGSQSSSSSGWSSGYSSGGFDFGSLADLFGSGFSASTAGVATGWNDGRDNRGTLNTEVADGARNKFTRIKGNGRDTVTIMIYMCGTDLESRSGMATSDLSEIAAADIGDNVNILVYTGGCTGWQNNIVSSKTNQIYRVRSGGLERLVSDDGDRTMTDPATLTRFIKWSAQNFPANRNSLIFWDHGSGSLSGYGYDQKHKSAGSMGLAQIQSAIKNGGVKFDFVGFDACLMACAENALALSPYADYLIASEETEPGTGWYYTNWVSALSENTSMDTLTLGKHIIDDFIDVSAKSARGQSTTLSLVDLAELSATFPEAFSAFSKSTGSLLSTTEFSSVSKARAGAREFAASTGIDQVDLADMAWKIGNEESMELVDSILGAVKYNRTSTSMCNSYGLSIYFPSSRLSKVDSMVSTYRQLGMDTDYTKCIQKYATVQTAGQSVSGGSSSIYDMLSGSGSYSGGSYSSGYGSSSGGYSTGIGTDFLIDMVGSLLGGRSVPAIDELDRSNTQYLQESGLEAEEVAQILALDLPGDATFTWTQADGQHVLSLPQEQWSKITEITVNMLFDDGEGYIDLGEDNVFSFTKGGELIGETDRTWLSVNGTPVSYYHIGTVREGETSVTTGYIPCMLNGERANLIVVFDQQNPYGYIAGARTDYVAGETETLAKAMTGLQDGDVIDFLCDYYDYDGNYSDTYYIGDQLVVDGTPVISNTDVGEGGALVTYTLTDLFGQKYYMPALAE